MKDYCGLQELDVCGRLIDPRIEDSGYQKIGPTRKERSHDRSSYNRYEMSEDLKDRTHESKFMKTDLREESARVFC